MEVTNTMGAPELLRKYLEEADADLLRSMVQSFAEALMSAEASGLSTSWPRAVCDLMKRVFAVCDQTRQCWPTQVRCASDQGICAGESARDRCP